MPLPPLLQKRAHALQRRLLSSTVLQELERYLKRQAVQKSDAQHVSSSDEENIVSFSRGEGLRLEEKFRLEDLLVLEEVFTNHNVQKTEESRSLKKRRQRPGNMTLEEFQEVLDGLFGSESWDDNIELLFNKVDTSCDGFVDWSEFCTYLLLQYKERDYVVARRATLVGEPVIRLCSRNKQEPTCRVVAISGPAPLWFMSVSKGGVLTVWNASLHPQKSYEMDSVDSQVGKRRFKSWVTDAVYMPNVQKVAVATTGRDIHFYDVSTLNILEEFHLFALSHVATCFHYWYSNQVTGSRSLLLWGDDKGSVNLLWLLKPNSGLFEKPFTPQRGPCKIYIQDLKLHSKFLSYQSIPDVHSEAITKVLYEPHQELVITSSGSSSSSVVIMDIYKRGKVYIWRISKGVQCFDYCRALNLLVTGGLDHKVRLWNQYVPKRPTDTFSEHTMAIVDVAIYEPLKQVFSYSKDSVLKVWDIASHSCLQTMVLKFPCIRPGHLQEQGSFPFLLTQSLPHRLLVSYADYIGMLKLAQTDPSEQIQATHEAPLSGVLYNSFFHQVVTASEDSTVIVWEVETGNKSLQLNNVHGEEEITCMTLDTSQRKLLTGARNGTIKIWNIQNGHNLHRLEPVEEAEVTCLLPLKEELFLSVGWNRKIIIYDVTKVENTYVSADESWKGGHLHTEDILTADYCPTLGLLVTASYDGEIIVWNTETQRMFLYLRKCPRNRSDIQGRASNMLRPRSWHRKQSGDCRCQPPVDKVYFLQSRSAKKDAAIVLSSEAGVLHWWSVFAQHRKFGFFYAPHKVDESVLGLTSDEGNCVLVTGDTAGFIQVWDISMYGLQAPEQAEEMKPPLLFSWAAHGGTVVSVEHFLYGSDPYILSSSSDCTARLWTCDGQLVGTFGHSRPWNLRKAPTCIRRNQGQKESDTDGFGFQGHKVSGATAAGGSAEEETSVDTSDCPTGPESAALGEMEIPNIEERSLVGHRNNAGINLTKCSRMGQLCSPFQALTVTEVEDLTHDVKRGPQSCQKPENREVNRRTKSETLTGTPTLF